MTVKELTHQILKNIENGDPNFSGEALELYRLIKKNPIEIWDDWKDLSLAGKFMIQLLADGMERRNEDLAFSVAHLSYSYLSRAMQLLQKKVSGELLSIQDVVNKVLSPIQAFDKTEILQDRIVLLNYFPQLFEHTIGGLAAKSHGYLSYSDIWIPKRSKESKKIHCNNGIS